MKRYIKLFVLLFMLLVLFLPNIVSARTPPAEMVISDVENFCAALQDDRIAVHYAWVADQFAAGNEEALNTPFPYQAEYPFFDDGVAYFAYEEFRAMGYIPVPADPEKFTMEIIENFEDRPFLLHYICQTEWGDVRLCFQFKNEQTAFAIEDVYAKWKTENNRSHVSYVTMQHGKTGVFSLYSDGFFSSCQSCLGSLNGKGEANLIAEYEDFVLEIAFLDNVTVEDARVFMQELLIEKRMIGTIPSPEA